VGGLGDAERRRIEQAFEFARSVYEDRLLGTGEVALEHALGLARSVAGLRLDADARAAGLLFAIPSYLPRAARSSRSSSASLSPPWSTASRS